MNYPELEKYLKHENSVNHLTGSDQFYTIEKCKEIDVYMDIFMHLCCALSPENLYCDGERSPQEARKWEKHFLNVWKELEQVAGVKFEIDDPKIYEYAEDN